MTPKTYLCISFGRLPIGRHEHLSVPTDRDVCLTHIRCGRPVESGANGVVAAKDISMLPSAVGFPESFPPTLDPWVGSSYSSSLPHTTHNPHDIATENFAVPLTSNSSRMVRCRSTQVNSYQPKGNCDEDKIGSDDEATENV
ncbi:hypothetical protein Fmac_005190 [Flemingia macrophylla]|uniref:Uncharacterized protein n=1 Tax=Flemingia macrophylla TaxID=520843 RepID=A0ABD1N713_9FABA